MDILLDLLSFALKLFLVLAGLLVIIAAARGGRKDRDEGAGHLRVRKLNDRWHKAALAMKRALLGKKALKRALEDDKQRRRDAKNPDRPRAYVVDYSGNVRASQNASLSEEVGAILEVARPGESVVVRLKSPGGVVHGYGLAASQLERLRTFGLDLTVVVDEVAASGGYMMAVVAHRIVSAPFAIVGSIGVVAGVPNFHRWLKRRDIDFELMTAGRYKRTVTMFGENTDEGRRKFQDELETAHTLFKSHIAKYRPTLDLDKVGTGEHWYGQEALGLGLVDALGTSDAHLRELGRSRDIFQVEWVPRRRFVDKLGGSIEAGVHRTLDRLWQRSEESRFP
jgi:serine protease SohB